MNRKRKIRHVLDWILALIIAVSLSALFFLGWVWYGVFNQSALNDWLNANGHYEIRYEQFMKETESCLDYLDIPKEVLDWEKIHTKFLVTSKADVFQNKKEGFSNSVKNVQEDQKPQNVESTEESVKVYRNRDLYTDGKVSEITEYYFDRSGTEWDKRIGNIFGSGVCKVYTRCTD